MSLTFARARPGRRVRASVPPPGGASRGRKCTRFVKVKGTITVDGKPGANRLRFQGRLSRKRRLKPGRYRATLVATDSAGNRSKAARATFRMLRRPKRR